MANIFPFDEHASQHTAANTNCAACEALLPDFLDGVLPLGDPDTQAWFDLHLATCAACSSMVADAQRGHAWLELLKDPRPEPSAALLPRILAQTPSLTTDAAAPAFDSIASGAWAGPAQIPVNLLPFPSRFIHPRLAMTAAMAFFSIALTLNLTGVRLNELHASELKPTNLWYQTTAQAHRSYDNLRVVHVLESRVNSFRSEAARPDENPAQTPNRNPTPGRNQERNQEQDQSPSTPQGTSQQQVPAARPTILLTQSHSRSRTEGGLA